jgi:hypothetical protein
MATQISVLRCLGDIEGPRFLEGHSAVGTVGFAPSTATPYIETSWELNRTPAGLYTLRCLGPSEGPRYLDGRTADGTVGLAPDTDPSTRSGTYWQLEQPSEGRYTLKCMGDIYGPRYLNGRTADGTVDLAPEARSTYTGATWGIYPPLRLETGPIHWFTSIIVNATDHPGWGRMLPWDQQGDNLITYTQYPAGLAPIIKVARSNPSVPTWTEIASIPSPPGCFWQEQSQMVQRPNGTIPIAMRNILLPPDLFPPHPENDDLTKGKWYGLPIVQSRDGGYTWQFLSQLDTNTPQEGQPHRGLWEPFLSVLPCIGYLGYPFEKMRRR